MKKRDPIDELRRRLLDAPQSIPNLRRKLEPEPAMPAPGRMPEIPMQLGPPAMNPNMPDYLSPFIPRAPIYPSPGPFPGRDGPGITPNVPKEFNPFRQLPDHAPPAVPDRPSTVANAELSSAPHWLASLASLPSPSSVPDAPPWLDPGPVGKSLRRLLGFPE